MTDYIKAAVELADGFSWKEYDGWRCDHPLTFYYGTGKEPSQWFLDALAAQLVRQVDAIGNESVPDHPVTEYWSGTIIQDKDKSQLVADVRGKDRTMNTIKAIVDSGVLDGNGQDR